MILKRWFWQDSEQIGHDFVLNGYGLDEPMPPGLVHRPQGTGDFLFMQFPQSVLLGSGSTIRCYPANTLMPWKAGSAHHYGLADDTWSHSWLHCHGRFVSSLIREFKLPLDRPIASCEPEPFSTLLTSLHKEFSEHLETDWKIVRNLFENWLRQLARSLREQEAAHATSNPLLLRVKDHLDARFAEPITLGELAESFHLSIPHLSARFREAFEQSPIDYLISVRLQHARHHLRNQALSIAEVGERVGYDNPYHFSRIFRKHVGMSPRQFRHQAAAN